MYYLLIDLSLIHISNKSGGLIMFIIEVVFLLLVIGAAILLVQGVRKIPVQLSLIHIFVGTDVVLVTVVL